MELLQPARPGLARLLLAAGACLLLAAAGCAGKRADQRLLHDTLYDYASAIRWGDLDAALSHVDPDYLRTHPLDSVERNRFQQLQVSGYYVKQSGADAEGNVQQAVEIRLINRHTQTERAILDRQTWRWDAEARRWWLTTGVPNLAPRR